MEWHDVRWNVIKQNAMNVHDMSWCEWKESKLIEMSSESAYFKDLLEKGLVIRKDLERSVADERTARTKSEDALASAKTATERVQEELDIVSKKYDEKQKEFDALKKETINFENQM